MRPSVGSYSRVRSLISVVFPEPFSPTSARLSPGRIFRLTLSSALPVAPGSPTAKAFATRFGREPSRDSRASDLLRRPEVDYAGLVTLPGLGPGVDDPHVAEQVEIQSAYAGYLERQRLEVERNRRHETMALPDGFDFDAISGLSNEVRQKLVARRPATLGQAARIPGVTPAAVSLLLVHIKRHGDLRRAG